MKALETATPQGASSSTVYLLDDDAGRAAALCRLLQDGAYQVQTFQDQDSLREALASSPGSRPDAVLVPLAPESSELERVSALGALGVGGQGGIPLLVLSSRDDLVMRLATHRAGATHYLLAPLNPTQFIPMLRQITGGEALEPYRVLMVDDDTGSLELHASMLRAAGMQVRPLSQPLQTLDVFDEFRPDVVLLDYYMPVAEGPELASVLRERAQQQGRELPILFLSSEDAVAPKLKALQSGGDDFLLKPVDTEHLVAAMTVRARRARMNNEVQRRLRHLRSQQEREHRVLDQHAIVSYTDPRGNIIYVNDKFCEISGYSRDELMGQNHRIVKSALHAPAFYQSLWEAISSGRVWHGEVCNRRRDGSLYWVESTIAPFLDATGLPYQYVSIRTDITRIKRSEQVLRTLAQGTASATDPEQFFPLTVQGLAASMSLRMAFIATRDPDDAQSCRTLSLWDQGRIADNFSYQLSGSPCENVLRDELCVFASGVAQSFLQDHWLVEQGFESYVGIPLHDAQGQVIGHMGVLDDKAMTDPGEIVDFLGIFAERVAAEIQRRRADELLRTSEVGLRATLEATTDGILAVNADGSIHFANQQFSTMWRVPVEFLASDAPDHALIEYAMGQLKDPDDFVREVRALYASDKESHDILEFKDGRFFDRRSKPIKDGLHGGRVWSFHDITARVHAEQASQADKERLRRGQLFANIGTWDWNILTGESFWTERIAPLFGYPAGDLATTYDNFIAAVHPDDRQAVRDAVNACVERDIPYDIEHRVVWPDGTVRWLLERGAVVRDKAGKPLQMLGVVQDIHDRKRAEMALTQRERELLEAQQLAHIGNWTADMSTGGLHWSDEIYRIFGHAPGSFSPSVEAFKASVHPDDRARVLASEKQAEQTGRHDVVHRIVRPDGTIRHVHELARAETNAAGQVVRLTGTVQDVTAQVEAETRLHETEARFAFAVEGAGDGIWDWDIASGAMPLSGQYEAMLGYAWGELVPTIEAWVQSVHPDDLPRVQASLQKYLEGKTEVYTPELRLRCKDGSFKWILCRGTVVARDGAGKPTRMIGIHSDISERKQTEVALVEARELAERANQAKSEFLSSMSHELRTPMNAILGFGQLLEYDDQLSSDNKDNVREILKAGTHLLALINEVLDLAKVESGHIDLSLEAVELQPVIKECLSLVGSLARQQDVTLSHNCASGVMLRADRTRLKQVLLNLVSNAVKYNRQGGRVWIEVQPGASNRLRVLVKDTGAGIPATRLKDLFQPFNRLGVDDSGIEGTGIGLTITRRLVELMGGEMGLHTELGVGSQFWFELPLQAGDEPDALLTRSADVVELAPAKPNTIQQVDAQKHTVLYIEDNPANIKLVEQILRRRTDIHLLTATTAEEGIELALACQPRLILLDINLPDMDGFQVLSVLRSDASVKMVPVIAVTANAMPDDVERGKAAGFSDYLTKPLAIDRFLSTLDHFLTSGITV